MKYSLCCRIIVGMLSAVSLLSSCSDDESTMTGNDVPCRTVTIMASLEGRALETRTCVDETTLDKEYIDLLWQVSDTLGVFGGATLNSRFTTTETNTTKAAFSGAMNEGDEARVAYFPYNSSNDGRTADNLTGILGLDQTYCQAYRAMNNDWKIGKPDGDVDGVFKFTHLFSIVRYTINTTGTDLEDEKLEKIVLSVTSADGSEERQLGGSFEFSANTGFIRFTDTPEDCNTITMTWMDRPELTTNTTYNGFMNVAPTIKQGDKVTVKVFSTAHVATVTCTATTDFEANYLYEFPLTMSGMDNLTVEKRTDIAVDEELGYHPCMLLRDEDIARIYTAIRTNPAIAGMHRHILDKCKEYLGETGLDYNIYSERLMTTDNASISEWYENRIMTLAYAYRMTRDTKYADKAIEFMLKAADFKDWNPTHFLDPSELGTGMALGYDWLYDYLTADQRSTIREAIYKKNLSATPGSSDVFTRTNNWNSICNAGRVICGLVLKKQYPTNCSKAISTAVSGNPKLLAQMQPKGCYIEGPDYFIYGNNYEVLLLEAMLESDDDNVVSQAKALANTQGFIESADWMLMMNTPTGGTFNFSDCNNGNTVNMIMPWFAANTGKPGLAYLESKALNEGRYSDFGSAMLAPLMSFLARVDLSAATVPNTNTWLNNESSDVQPMYVYRSGWNSTEDAYLGVKGGMMNNSHGHQDAGSFIYEKEGVRWAIDMGGQAYSIFEEASKSATQSSAIWNYNNSSSGVSTSARTWTRWFVYRYTNPAHNTITINDAEHAYNGKATITASYNESYKHGAMLNLQPVLKYPTTNGQYVQSATREIYLDASNDLTVIDKIKAGSSKEATVKWVMVTEATVTINSNNTATLEQDGKKMLLSVSSTGTLSTAVNVQSWSNEGPNSWDVANTGTTRIGFTATIGKNNEVTFTTTLKAQ